MGYINYQSGRPAPYLQPQPQQPYSYPEGYSLLYQTPLPNEPSEAQPPSAPPPQPVENARPRSCSSPRPPRRDRPKRSPRDNQGCQRPGCSFVGQHTHADQSNLSRFYNN
ncbi:hypothetical protein JAAARDRAFT_582721 [Jaapia argillacea MUCL 33604]|uniref:Uncharacterized protein n=1 Tax=Jaapia argillacea MUCL 33604 TaxID=933084 RepID=A0A067P6L3_9AGAM|nr:hypothetical protein JAAARDRAFT_582721 [Jaapia argillacea MUCL 33604]